MDKIRFENISLEEFNLYRIFDLNFSSSIDLYNFISYQLLYQISFC